MRPVLPELHQTGHAEDVEVEADPGEGEDHPQAPEHQAVELDHPAEGGEPRAVELEGEHVSLAAALGPGAGQGTWAAWPGVTLLTSLIT